MFTKTKPTQLELFSAADNERISVKNSSGAFFEKIASYEKNIILGICFIVIFIASYALGIEKGKKINLGENKNITLKAPISRANALPEPTVKIIATPVDKKEGKSAPQDLGRDEKLDVENAYTVQVASFKNRALAEREKTTLGKKGFQAYLLAKNKFVIVCVGSFENKDTAQLSLKQLKRIYGDCLIRKL